MSHGPHVELVSPPAPQYPGTFIAFEGGEGAGKSTQVQQLGRHLAGRADVVLTREPGGTPAAEAIRAVLLDPRHTGLDPRAEALLFAAARGEHVRSVIMPALLAGKIVVTDRYIDSSVAYQGVARGLGRDLVEAFSLWAAGGLVPDLTVVLDVDEVTGLGRAGDPNRMEAEPRSFHRTVRRAFLGLAARAPHRYLVVDSGQDAAAVAAEVGARVMELLAQRAAAAKVPARDE